MKTANGQNKKTSKGKKRNRPEIKEIESEENIINPKVFKEARAAILILCGLFLMFAITNPNLSGSIGSAIGNFLNSITGWASFMFPFLLILAGCHVIKKFPKKILLFYPSITIAMIWIIEILRASLFPDTFGSAGFIGSFIAGIMTSAVGQFGTGSILVLSAIGCVLLFSGMTAGDIASKASEKIKKVTSNRHTNRMELSDNEEKLLSIKRNIPKNKDKIQSFSKKSIPSIPTLHRYTQEKSDDDRGEDFRRNRFLSDEPSPTDQKTIKKQFVTKETPVVSKISSKKQTLPYILENDYSPESMLIVSGDENKSEMNEDIMEQGRLEFENEPLSIIASKDSEQPELMFITSEDNSYDSEESEELNFDEDGTINIPYSPIENKTSDIKISSYPKNQKPPAILPQIFRNDFIPGIPGYPKPSISILAEKDPFQSQSKPPKDYSEALVEKLESFNVEATVTGIVRGPAITRYELRLGDRIKVSKFTSLHQDLSVFFANKIRIEAPVPGKSCVGIEVPNETIEPVYLREVIGSEEFKKKNRKIPIALGKDINGNTVVGDLAKMPHLLVAGSTGSGKSVCMNCIIASILFKFSPAEAQLVMIDPKQVELSMYEGIPHLIDIKATPDSRIITDPKIASAVLTQMTEIMDARYKELKRMKTKNIFEYNEKSENPMPYLIILIDEFFDLMMVSGGAIEAPICRLTQLGRAAGIHLVIATQRPTVNCITGTIKVNVPSRIAFAVTNAIDSKTIIDKAGAENLLGKGDMLYQPADAGEPRRVQGAFMSTEEAERLVSFWQAQPIPENMLAIEAVSQEDRDDNSEDENDEKDDLYDEAIDYILSSPKNASVSSLQRKFRIGYPRAGKIMDQLEAHGVVGPADGSKPRKILIGQVSVD